MSTQSDKELVLSVQSGDLHAFEVLVERYQYGLHVFAVRYVHDADAASDIVQDTFITLYRVIDTVDTAKKLSTFLFEIAKNKAISYLRTRKKLVPLTEAEDISAETSFIEEYLREDVIARVRKAVSELPEKYERVVTLYYFRELSYEEIADKLSVPINTVRTHLKRAKDRLKTMLPYEND